MKNNKIGVLIVDSEPESQTHIRNSIQSNSLIDSIESAQDSDEALMKFLTFSPDLVLLEYPVQGKTGKEFIKFIQAKQEDTIIAFLSKTKNYAASAIRSGVFNYLLKPVSPEKLENLVSKVHQIKHSNINLRVQELIENSNENTRLRFQTVKGYTLLEPEDILYCKSEGFYTEIYLTDGKIELSYLFISKLDEILKQFNFMRVSRSFLVNLRYVRKLFSGKNIIVLSVNGKEIEIKASKPKMKLLYNLESE